MAHAIIALSQTETEIVQAIISLIILNMLEVNFCSSPLCNTLLINQRSKGIQGS